MGGSCCLWYCKCPMYDNRERKRSIKATEMLQICLKNVTPTACVVVSFYRMVISVSGAFKGCLENNQCKIRQFSGCAGTHSLLLLQKQQWQHNSGKTECCLECYPIIKENDNTAKCLHYLIIIKYIIHSLHVSLVTIKNFFPGIS